MRCSCARRRPVRLPRRRRDRVASVRPAGGCGRGKCSDPSLLRAARSAAASAAFARSAPRVRPGRPDVAADHPGDPAAGFHPEGDRRATRGGLPPGATAGAAGAQAKAAEVDAKIAHLQEIRATLTSVVEAGCSDLSACSGLPRCPIPFAGLAAPDTRSPGDLYPAGPSANCFAAAGRVPICAPLPLIPMEN